MPATSTSRVRRGLAGVGLLVGSKSIIRFRSYWLQSERPVQYGRPLDEGDREKQQDEDAERERDRDRTLATAFLLRLGEADSIRLALVIHCVAMRPLPNQRDDGADHDLEQQGRKQRKQVKDR